MKKNKIHPVLIIILSAILVVVLLNIRTFISYFEAISSMEGIDNSLRMERGGLRILYMKQLMMFYTPADFIIFCLVAYFNFSWINKIIKLIRLRKANTIIFIISNIFVFFILLYCEKLTFKEVFESSPFEFRDRLLTEFDILNISIKNISIFLFAVIVAFLLILINKMKKAEQDKIKLVEDKNKAELAALKEHISPHFFFNTLSSLSTIIRKEKKETGIEFIEEMSNTYRYTLSSKQQDLVSLGEELGFLESYLFLLKKRYGEKLSFKIDISDNAHKSKLPPMSLQLLVENGIQHNVITKSSPLVFKIFEKENMICVENNLLEKESNESFGTGLQNLASRYRLLSKKDIVINKDEQYFRVFLPLL